MNLLDQAEQPVVQVRFVSGHAFMRAVKAVKSRAFRRWF